MSKVKYLLKSPTENICLEGLVELRNEYCCLLKTNEFPIPPTESNAIDIILHLKRKDYDNPLLIGVYENITVFEAANRIASDLIIINGLLHLADIEEISDKSIFTVRLGTTHIKGKGDFSINGEEGEAFNVAPSFFSVKLRQTKEKWKKENKLRYILVNEDASAKTKQTDERLIVIPENIWRNID